MEYTHLVSAAALVTNEEGQILLVKSPWRGWEYPGGLIEPGESFEAALKREVYEEAGVQIEITGFVGICKNLERNIVWFTKEQAMERITFPLTKKRLANMLSGDGRVHLFGFRRENGFEVMEELEIPLGKDGN